TDLSSLSVNLSSLVKGLEKHDDKLLRLQQLWLVLTVHHLLHNNIKLSEYLGTENFPLYNLTQCSFLSVKLIDHIISSSNISNLTQVNSNLELMFLNLFSLKLGAESLVTTGCVREADSFLFILAQQSISLQSISFFSQCIKYFSKNLLNNDHNKFQLFQLNFSNFNFNYHQNDHLDSKILSLDLFLIFKNKDLPNEILSEISKHTNLLYDHELSYCQNPITMNIYDSKLNILQKIKSLNLEKVECHYPCCEHLPLDLRAKFDLLSSSQMESLVSTFNCFKISSNENKMTNSSLGFTKFFLHNVVETKRKLRLHAINNFNHLNNKEISSLFQMSMFLSFSHYFSLLQTRHFFNFFKNIKQNFKFNTLTSLFTKTSSPEMTLNEIESVIYDQLYPKIPSDWTVIHLNYLKSSEYYFSYDRLIITINSNSDPLIINKAIEYDSGFNFQTLLSEIITENDESSKYTAADYWETRFALEARLENLINTLNSLWFQQNSIIIHGKILDEDLSNSTLCFFSKFKEKYKKNVNYHVFQSLIFNSQLYDSKTLYNMISDLEPKITKTMINWIVKNVPASLIEAYDSLNRGPIVLIVDEILHEIPFESFPSFQSESIYRMPSLLATVSLISYRQLGKIKGLTSLIMDSKSCFYVLNPQKNLDRTQKYFQNIFSQIPSWEGIIAQPPTEEECADGLQTHHLFIYCGHGNGKEYIKNDFIRKIDCSAVVMLMGCHSAKLHNYDSVDPMGTVLYYLLSGCPSIVANLWGVTDKDIDKFLNYTLYDVISRETPLGESIRNNRSVCNLRYLNGAAPVIY
ncbi:hypothetical protein HZS_5702, partial [Henneguya salminicola]